MLSKAERDLGIIGYRAICATVHTEKKTSAPQMCPWQSGCCANSTAATDALYQHFRSEHPHEPIEACLGNVIPVDALPLEVTTDA